MGNTGLGILLLEKAGLELTRFYYPSARGAQPLGFFSCWLTRWEKNPVKHRGIQIIWTALSNLLQTWAAGIGEPPFGGQRCEQHCGSRLHLLEEQRGDLH